MAGITHAFIQNEPRTDGQALVVMRITAQRLKRYVDTGITVKPTQFNPDGNAQQCNWIRRSHPSHELYNQTLKAWHDRIETLINRLRQQNLTARYTAQQVKDRLLGRQDESLSGFIEGKINAWFEAGQDDNAKNHSAMLANLREFMHGYRLPKRKPKQAPVVLPAAPVIELADLGPDEIERFDKWLMAKPRQHKRTTEATRRNYTTDQLRRLRQHITAYIARYRLPSEMDPTRGLQFQTIETEAVRLTEAELIIWENASWPLDSRNAQSLWAARTLYLASYYLHGIRVGDLLSARVDQLETIWEMLGGKPRQVTRLYYTSDKKDKTKSVLVEPFLLDMLGPYLADKEPDQFIFPFLPARLRHWDEKRLGPEIDKRVSYVNRLLKQVANNLGTNPRVTMHTARHTFADQLSDQVGDLRIVQQALGHSDIRTTQRYVARFKQTIVDQANDLYTRRRDGTTTEQKPESDGTDRSDNSQKSA